jgi:hypothetical protein
MGNESTVNESMVNESKVRKDTKGSSGFSGTQGGSRASLGEVEEFLRYLGKDDERITLFREFSEDISLTPHGKKTEVRVEHEFAARRGIRDTAR